jgi:hypothetical protein
MTLREWLLLYLRHRDAYARKLQRIEEKGDEIVCAYLDHQVRVYALERLQVPRVTGKTVVATLQTRENVEFLLKHWGEFERLKELTIIFVNPARNEKWLLKPALHSQISEGKVDQGIWSIADGIAYV